MTGNAKINQLDSRAGYAWCGLRVDLGAVLPTSDMVRLAGVKNEELRPELVSTREEDSLLLGLSAPLSILRRTLRSRDSRTWLFIN